MQIGDVLVAKGVLTLEQLSAAAEQQAGTGAGLAEVLAATGLLTVEDFEAIAAAMPVAPSDIAQTGIAEANLLALLLKAIHTENLETPSQFAATLKLSSAVIDALLKEALDRKLIEVLGTAGEAAPGAELRHALSKEGQHQAKEALELNQYVGPAPVPLSDFAARVREQGIGKERVTREQVLQAFSDMVVSDAFVRRIGPAINSGRSILMYGPAGNGKTSVAERVGSIFADVIYLPHCVEIEGQIVKLYDPSLHKAIPEVAARQTKSVRRDRFDHRWVACERPIVITGGELTLEMLDLKYNDGARFYEAPLHMKALNGTFIIDDFGRQIVSPEEMLNRWIVPLQSRVDYLKLHTGKSFQIPFDELVIFSTNMSPDDLMDPAFLRRIPYKMEVGGPNREGYHAIFQAVAKRAGMDLPDDVFAYVVEQLTLRNGRDLAGFQPRFIVDQVLAACKFEGVDPTLRKDLVGEALTNLYTNLTLDEEPPLAAE